MLDLNETDMCQSPLVIVIEKIIKEVFRKTTITLLGLKTGRARDSCDPQGTTIGWDGPIASAAYINSARLVYLCTCTCTWTAYLHMK